MSSDDSVSPYPPVGSDVPSFAPPDAGQALPPAFPALDPYQAATPPAIPTMPLAPGMPAPAAPAPAAPVYPSAFPPALAPMPQAPYGTAPAGVYPPGWGQGQSAYPYQASLVATNQKNKFGIMALIFGILAILELIGMSGGGAGNPYLPSIDPGGYFGYLAGELAFPVLALCMGITGIRACGRGQANNRGMAIAGVIMGGIFLVILLIGLAIILTQP